MRAVAAAIVVFLLALGQSPAPVVPQRAAPTIYSSRADDPWNRIFALLFTRTIRASRLGDTATFDTYEEGDRAVEALYPSFITARGTDYVLAEPAQQALVAALNEALAERSPRPPLDRALMQADLWSAFDALAARADRPGRTTFGRDAARALLPPLARLIGKLALTPAEIAALPDNYASARTALQLPDLFGPGSEWMEIVRGQHRLHDDAADFRRASRVFVRPPARPADEARFLAALPAAPASKLSSAALVMQTLLIDSRGRVVPSRLTSDIQIRSITREGRRGSSAYGDAPVHEFELSRRKLRLGGRDGGFMRFDAAAPAYLALAGNDYGFATPMRDQQGETVPSVSTLQVRCATCHGTDGAGFMTLELTAGPDAPPYVVRLRQPNDDRANYVAAAKEARSDFKRLLEASGLRR